MYSHVEMVTRELQGMKELGINVPFDPNNLTDKQKETINEFRENGMKISEIADFLCSEALKDQRRTR